MKSCRACIWGGLLLKPHRPSLEVPPPCLLVLDGRRSEVQMVCSIVRFGRSEVFPIRQIPVQRVQDVELRARILVSDSSELIIGSRTVLCGRTQSALQTSVSMEPRAGVSPVGNLWTSESIVAKRDVF